MRGGWGVGIAAMAVAISLGARSAPDAAPADPMIADIQAAAKAFDAGKCDEALPVIRRLTANPLFSDVPERLAALVWSMGAGCAADQNLSEELFADTRAATGYPGADDRLWRWRLELGMWLYQPDDVIEAAELLVHIRPAVLSQIDAQHFSMFEDRLRKSGASALRRRLYAALVQADYHPPDPFQIADALWLAYASMMVDDGDLAAARSAADRLRFPGFVVAARLDKRFAALVAASPNQFDVRAAAERQLAADQAAAKAQPKLAAGVVAVARDLRLLGRGGEALTLVQDAQARAAKARMPDTVFTDLDRQANWLADERAEDLLDQGRYDEWVAAMRQAASLKEAGDNNVSQLINLAEALTFVKRPQEALEVLKPFGDAGDGRRASPYGVMEMMDNRACAYAQLERIADVAAAVEFMAAHETDNAAALTNALLCTGDLAGAAASFIRRLRDPDARLQALRDLSDLSDKPPMTPFEIELDRRTRVVGDRPDVKAAIAAVGHVETIPLREGAL